MVQRGILRVLQDTSRYFVDFKKFENPSSIRAAGKEKLIAVGSGTIEFIATVNNKCQRLTLCDVWYVPNVCRNLFSVLAAQDRHQNSEFKSRTTKCWLNVNGKLVLCGVRQRNMSLYKAVIQPILPKIHMEINLAVSDDSLLQLYHERWGHEDKRYVKKMLELV